jgi:hypothetical protein
MKLEKKDAILKVEVIKMGKSNNRRYLAVHNKGIVIYKTATYDKPHRFFPFSFEYKFEVIRDPPTLKASA